MVFIEKPIEKKPTLHFEKRENVNGMDSVVRVYVIDGDYIKIHHLEIQANSMLIEFYQKGLIIDGDPIPLFGVRKDLIEFFNNMWVNYEKRINCKDNEEMDNLKSQGKKSIDEIMNKFNGE